MQIGTFFFGTLIASGAATAAAIGSGGSILAALGFGGLTALLAQILYLVLITALAAREADSRRIRHSGLSKSGTSDQKPIGTAQP